MREFFRRKRDPTTTTPGLEPAKVILSFVASLGDGAISIPGLKAAAQIAIKIIEVAQVRVWSRFVISRRCSTHCALDLAGSGNDQRGFHKDRDACESAHE
jgi:hypothetical protein